MKSKDYLDGVFAAYIFKSSDIAFMDKLKTEVLSLEELRGKYVTSVDNLEIFYDNRIKGVDVSLLNFKKELNEWKEKIIIDQNHFNETKQKELVDLKQLYEEKLRFDSAAKYWNELYQDYIKKGRIWLAGSISLTFMGIAFLTGILYEFPSCFKNNGKMFSPENIKGTLIFTLIVSLSIYIIRLLVKLSTSAYHLARDAKERYQLTFIYFAMLEEKGITQDDKAIILQSLFSRADTGLLKGDHSPTLPEGIMKVFGATK